MPLRLHAGRARALQAGHRLRPLHLHLVASAVVPVMEAQLQSMVVDLAKWCGYLCYHPHDSRRSVPGFPDLTMVHTRNGRLIFAELKSEKGRIRPEQKVWAEHLGRHHEFYIWRPVHWTNGTIRSVLTAETRRAAA